MTHKGWYVVKHQTNKQNLVELTLEKSVVSVNWPSWHDHSCKLGCITSNQPKQQHRVFKNFKEFV